MTDYKINVIVDPSTAKTGTAAIKSELVGLQSETEKLRTLIQGAFSFIGISFGIKALADLADAYTAAQNRVRVVTSSHAELRVVMDKLFETASKTGVKLESTVNTYQRIALAGKNLGLSQKDFIDITRGLTESAAISGTGTQKMAFGLQEVAQSMGQASLRGREVRAIINDIPYAAIAIVNELNRTNPALHATTATLKELAAQGALTPKLIADAFRGAGLAKIDEEFNKISPTIGRAIESLRTNLIKFIGDLNNSSGIQGTFAQGILTIAANLETLARYAALAGGVIAVKFVAEGIRSAIVALKDLTVALFLNPFSAFLTLIGLATGAIIGFGDQFLVATGHIATWQDFAITALNDVGTAMGHWIDYGLTVWNNWYKGADNANKNIKFSFQDLLLDTAAFTDELYVQFVYYQSRIANLFVPNEFKHRVSKEDIRSTLQENDGGTTGVINAILTQADKRAATRNAANKIQQDEYNRALANLGLHGDAINNPEGKLTEFEKIRNKLQGEADVGIQRPGEDYFVQSQLAKYTTELVNQKQPPSAKQKEDLETLLTKVYRLKELDDIYKQVDKSQEAYKEGIPALNDLWEKGLVDVDQYNKELLKLKQAADQTHNTLISGLSVGLDEIAAKFTDVNSLAANTLVDAFSNAENAIVKFTQTGKLNFTQMVNSMVTDIERLLVRQNLTAPIAQGITSLLGGKSESGGFNGSNSLIGGLFSFIGSKFFADGDIFSGPTPLGFSNGNLNIGGEAGPEGVLPLRRTSSGALGVIATGSSGGHVFSPNITVNMQSSGGSTSNDAQTANRVAIEIQKRIEQGQADFVRRQQRTGGMLEGNKATTI